MGRLLAASTGVGRVGESVTRAFIDFDLVVLFKYLETGLFLPVVDRIRAANADGAKVIDDMTKKR